MARGARDALFLIRGIVMRIRHLRRLLDAGARQLCDQGLLLVFERRMAIEADPDMLVFRPVRLEERIHVRTRVNAALPFLIDLAMALPARLGPEVRNAGRDRLIWNRRGIIRAQSKNDDR